MTSFLDSSSSAGDRARTRAYLRDFLPAMAAYGVLLAAVLALGGLDGHSPSRYVWALVPVFPALGVVRAVLRHLHRIDDYQQLVLLRGLGIGFAVAMLTAVTVGFLEIAGLQLSGVGWIVYAAGMLTWAVHATLSRG